MPRHDLIRSRWDIGELEASTLIRDRIVRMRNHYHFRVHPHVATVASQVNQSGSRHGACNGPVRERKGQVKRGGTIHVDGVQGRIGTHHSEGGAFRNQENVRNVMAMSLVEMSPLFGQIHGFSGRDILKVDDGIRKAALRPDDQPLEIDGLFGVRIADLRIFSDGKIERVRNGSRPFYGPGNRPTVADGFDPVAALREARASRGHKESQQAIL